MHDRPGAKDRLMTVGERSVGRRNGGNAYLIICGLAVEERVAMLTSLDVVCQRE